MIPLAKPDPINQIGVRRPQRPHRVAIAAAKTVARRLPPVEVLATLAVVLVFNVIVGIEAVRGDRDSELLRSVIPLAGDVIRITVQALLLVVGVVGVAALLLAGFVLPELLEERERTLREERATRPGPVVSNLADALNRPSSPGDCIETQTADRCDEEVAA
jgi:hypothetical protein